MTDLFGGMILFGAQYVALEWVCAARNEAPLDVLQQSRFSTNLMADHHDPAEKERVWWHHTHDNGVQSWISINPGEFRTEPPDPPCIIKEMPQGLPAVSDNEILEKAIGSVAHIAPLTEREKILPSLARQLLARREDGIPSTLLERIRNVGASDTRPTLQKRVDDLYEQFLFNYRVSLADFACAVLMMKVQLCLGSWIAEDWRDNPIGYATAVARHAFSNESGRAGAVSALKKLCVEEFNDAREWVDKALDGTMANMPRRLMMGWHGYFICVGVLDILMSLGLAESDLPVSRILPDEGAACTITGITDGAAFVTLHPNSYPLELLARSRPDVSFKALRQAAIPESSAIQPSFTVHFSKILAAHALTLSGSSVREGIDELILLAGQSTELADEFERSWIDHALLNAYKDLGDDEAVRSVAHRIAAQLVVRNALGK